MYLGIKAVIVKSFARIHLANLINFGIIPLTFDNSDDYDKLNQGDSLKISGILGGLDAGELWVENLTDGKKYKLVAKFTERQMEILKAGGLLAYTREKNR